MTRITTIEDLKRIYGDTPTLASIAKEVPSLTPEYRRIIELSPFVALATSGLGGLDCSPRGDRPGFVRIVDDTTLMMPDRHGNNRIDSLSNIIFDSRVALLFLVPGSGTTFRVNGTAQISVEPSLLESFCVDGKPPRSVIIMTIATCYFQCARAIVRSGLWTAEAQQRAAEVPTPGKVLHGLTNGRIDGVAYDTEWPERATKTLW